MIRSLLVKCVSTLAVKYLLKTNTIYRGLLVATYKQYSVFCEIIFNVARRLPQIENTGIIAYHQHSIGRCI